MPILELVSLFLLLFQHLSPFYALTPLQMPSRTPRVEPLVRPQVGEGFAPLSSRVSQHKTTSATTRFAGKHEWRYPGAATLLRGKRKYVNGVIPAPEARNELAQSEASACEAVRLGKAGIIMEPRRGGTTIAFQERHAQQGMSRPLLL
jgi:hypothetical protein